MAKQRTIHAAMDALSIAFETVTRLSHFGSFSEVTSTHYVGKRLINIKSQLNIFGTGGQGSTICGGFQPLKEPGKEEGENSALVSKNNMRLLSEMSLV